MMPHTIRCMIVDDEPHAHEVIKAHLQTIPSMHCVASCFGAPDALLTLRTTPIDLVFLDIQMPKLSGVDWVRALPHPPKIIFVTAFRDFAMDGFELGAVDYLLKPVSFERFVKAVNKVMEQPLVQPSTVMLTPTPGFLYFRADRKMVKVLLKDIRFAESLKDYVRLVTSNGQLVTKLTLSGLMDMLPEENFLQIHRSFVVATEHVQAYSSDAIRIGEHDLPIGPLYREIVRRKLALLKWP